MSAAPAHETGGLYVHVPFCRQLCPYCDFAVAVRRLPPHDAYCDALIAEWSSRPPTHRVTTVYFGGGTPGMWSLTALARFCATVTRDAGEVTIEANPHDITKHRLDAWHDLGINRVSLGVQSFDDGALQGLGRDHDGAMAARAAALLVGDGRFRSSIDLIYGGPRYSSAVLRGDLARVADLRPGHVSAYQLTVERDTVFGVRQRRGDLKLPVEDDVIDFGFELAAALGEQGLCRYEVSSYGRGTDRGEHNAGYWLGRPYVGIGVGAHSMQRDAQGVVRRRNVRNLKAYLADPLTPAEVEHVVAEDHLAERLFLACRTTIGTDWSELRARFDDVPSAAWDRVERARDDLQKLGWVDDGTDVLRATPRGLDFADAIAERFWNATRNR